MFQNITQLMQKQVILLMISNKGKREAKSKVWEAKSEGRQLWNYLAVIKISALLRAKNKSDFYCLSCRHSFIRKTNLNRINDYVKIKIFVM